MPIGPPFFACAGGGLLPWQVRDTIQQPLRYSRWKPTGQEKNKTFGIRSAPGFLSLCSVAESTVAAEVRAARLEIGKQTDRRSR